MKFINKILKFVIDDSQRDKEEKLLTVPDKKYLYRFF